MVLYDISAPNDHWVAFEEKWQNPDYTRANTVSATSWYNNAYQGGEWWIKTDSMGYFAGSGADAQSYVITSVAFDMRKSSADDPLIDISIVFNYNSSFSHGMYNCRIEEHVLGINDQENYAML